jgi:hypothetical protein
MKACLLGAAEEAGNRMVAISNAQLPKRPVKFYTKALIELLHQDPKGTQSYFVWLAENHPGIFAQLLGRALPNIMLRLFQVHHLAGLPCGLFRLV